MGDQGGGCSHLHAQSTLDAHKPQGRRQFLCTCHHPNTCARALLAEHRTPPATTRMQWCGAAPTNCGEPLGGSSCLYHVSWCRNGYLPRTGSRIWALRGPHGRPSPELRKRFQTRTAPCFPCSPMRRRLYRRRGECVVRDRMPPQAMPPHVCLRGAPLEDSPSPQPLIGRVLVLTLDCC